MVFGSCTHTNNSTTDSTFIFVPTISGDVDLVDLILGTAREQNSVLARTACLT
jgi:hypothetical protein